MTLAVVTGASRGIGRATALALAGRQVELALLGRSSPELEETAWRASAISPGRVQTFACELAEPKEVIATCQAVIDSMGSPDAIVNNAGIIERGAVVDTSVEAWDRQLDVNLRAPFIVSRTFLTGMLERRTGRIVHVASISSTLGTAGAAAYCAAKWGLVGFMKSLAEELRDTGVSTVAVLPGSVDTRMLEGSAFEPRMTAEDVASTLVFHCLDAPTAHNGGVIEMFGT